MKRLKNWIVLRTLNFLDANKIIDEIDNHVDDIANTIDQKVTSNRTSIEYLLGRVSQLNEIVTSLTIALDNISAKKDE